MRRLLAASAAALVLAPGTAHAQRAQSVGVNSSIPTRIDHLIGFTPSHGMHPPNQPFVPIRVRFGGRSFRFVYLVNSSVVGHEWKYTRSFLRDAARSSGLMGAFTDRTLSAAERRFARVAIDLGRDADVLAVAKGHPACAGITRDQARAIGARRFTRWSQLGLSVTPDAIAVRHTAAAADVDEPRLGGGTDRPGGLKPAYDGGLSQAASGNAAIAAVTSWSRARRWQRSVCVVPIGGVAPSDETVRDLRYPAAYRVAYVVPRWRRASLFGRAVMKGFVDWLAGPKAKEQFRKRGMLLMGEAWPAVPGPQPDPQPQPQPEPEPEPPADDPGYEPPPAP